MNVRLAYVIGAIALFVAGMGLQVITTETGDAEVEAEFTFVDAAPTTTTSTTTSTTTTTTTTTVPPPRTARVAFTGDLLPHGSVQRAGTATVDDGTCEVTAEDNCPTDLNDDGIIGDYKDPPHGRRRTHRNDAQRRPTS